MGFLFVVLPSTLLLFPKTEKFNALSRFAPEGDLLHPTTEELTGLGPDRGPILPVSPFSLI